jgi:hypothetical protein
MAFVATDLAARYSVTTGAVGGATAGTPAGSLGRWCSTTAVDWATVFDTITATENAAGTTDYRCIFLVNPTSTTMANLVVWIDPPQGPPGATVYLAVDPAGASAVTSATAQAAQIATETTAPAGVTGWSLPPAGSPLALGDLPGGSCIALWLKRTVNAAGQVIGDGCTLHFRSAQVA